MDKLYYTEPARLWREALPIGNGFTGVMIYGGTKKEKLCFNDCTLWSGYPNDCNNPQSLAALEKVRNLIWDGKNKEADELAQKEMCGFYSETFLPLGEAEITFSDFSEKGYKRELDLSNAVHTVSNEEFVREAFASNPHRVVAYKITSKNPAEICIKIKSKLKNNVLCDNGLYLIGNAPDYVAPNYVRSELRPVKYGEKKGMAFCLGMRVQSDGDIIYKRKSIVIKQFTQAILFFVTETGFNGFDKMPETDREAIKSRCKEHLDSLKDTYSEIKNKHIEDYKRLFESQSISLGVKKAEIETDKLIEISKNEKDIRQLCELFYNYGKYMTISASRAGGQAMNLQGIWNNSVRPPWSSNYTVNINTEMNYWGASACGLDECVEPLLRMVYEILQNGKKTARVNYDCRGFACNHNVDIWRKTSPVKGTANYMLEPLCGIWLANEVYSHYKNGALQDYRDLVCEIAEGAALFCLDYLVMHNGKYVISPSPSAENCFRHNGKICYLDYASAFDMGLVRQAFANALEISENNELKLEINEKSEKLYPFVNGENGICEWHKDYEMPEKGHRHFSPLYSFYPGKIIGFYRDEEQTELVRRLFNHRIENSGQYIGWSAAWAMCLAARLRDAETAEKVIRDFLGNAVFKNLFCVHPPFLFQIDGNMGYIAGINEMLITEENGIVELLPALPETWSNGSVRDILVNGSRISFEWQNGKVVDIACQTPVKVLNKNLADDVKHSETVSVITF